MRKEFYFPKLSDRDERPVWEAAGARTAREQAREIATRILNTHEPVRWPAEIEARIRREIPGLV